MISNDRSWIWHRPIYSQHLKHLIICITQNHHWVTLDNYLVILIWQCLICLISTFEKWHLLCIVLCITERLIRYSLLSMLLISEQWDRSLFCFCQVTWNRMIISRELGRWINEIIPTNTNTNRPWNVANRPNRIALQVCSDNESH